MVRRCTPADERIWVEMNREFMAYEYEDENVWESPLDKGDPAEVFRRILSEPEGGSALFMVEDEGRPIGFMNTVIFYSVWAHGKVLFLDEVRLPLCDNIHSYSRYWCCFWTKSAFPSAITFIPIFRY